MNASNGNFALWAFKRVHRRRTRPLRSPINAIDSVHPMGKLPKGGRALISSTADRACSAVAENSFRLIVRTSVIIPTDEILNSRQMNNKLNNKKRLLSTYVDCRHLHIRFLFFCSSLCGCGRAFFTTFSFPIWINYFSIRDEFFSHLLGFIANRRERESTMLSVAPIDRNRAADKWMTTNAFAPKALCHVPLCLGFHYSVIDIADTQTKIQIKRFRCLFWPSSGRSRSQRSLQNILSITISETEKNSW